MPSGNSSAPERIGILFLCYANICRSPLAEGIFCHLVNERGVAERFVVDSAGVSAIEGAGPHRNSIAVARAHGIGVAGMARQLVRDDLFRYTHILVMDRYVLSQLTRLRGPGASEPPAKLRLFQKLLNPDAIAEELDINDPISGTYTDFEATFQTLRTGCEALLDELLS
ncbi:MAG: low molecular weight protein-tyrosine-phosphatase [Nannocystaceae bacterium]